MDLFRREKDGDILYFHLRNDRNNLQERGEKPLPAPRLNSLRSNSTNYLTGQAPVESTFGGFN
jgi:hypothetical protein